MLGGVVAVVVAAGQGRRFGGPTPKQFLPLRGLPVLAHTLRALAVPGLVDRLVLAVPEGETGRRRDEIVGPQGLAVPVALVPGGAERQDSVRAGLAAAGEAEIVVVHDGVRPFVPRRDLEAVIAAARAHGAAILATPVTDTLKRAAADGRVEATVSREGLWAALTPQAFRREVLLRAHLEAAARAASLENAAAARAASLENAAAARAASLRADAGVAAPAPPATDDALLVERLGLPVAIVPGARTNIKITSPADLAVAEALLTWWATRRVPFESTDPVPGDEVA